MGRLEDTVVYTLEMRLSDLVNSEHLIHEQLAVRMNGYIGHLMPSGQLQAGQKSCKFSYIIRRSADETADRLQLKTRFTPQDDGITGIARIPGAGAIDVSSALHEPYVFPSFQIRILPHTSHRCILFIWRTSSTFCGGRDL